MNRKTRLFLAISAGLLVVGVGVALLAPYLGLSAIALGGAEGPVDLKYVPATARMVAYVDLHDLMDSEARRLFLKNHQEPNRVGPLESATGIDAARDVDSMIVFVGRTSAAGKTWPAIVARGRFDAVRIEGFIREHAGEALDYNGKRLIHHAGEGGDTAVSFLEPDLMAFGPVSDVRQCIDVANGEKAITSNDRMMELKRQLAPGNIWIIGNFEAVAPDGLPREIADRIPAITWFAASARVRDAVDGSIHVEARDDRAAKDLRDVVQGLIAMGRLHAAKGAPAQTLIESIQLTGNGRQIGVEFSLPNGVLAEFASRFPARH